MAKDSPHSARSAHTQLQDSACQLAWLLGGLIHLIGLRVCSARLDKHLKITKMPKSLWSSQTTLIKITRPIGILQESFEIQRQNRYEIKHGKSLIQNIIVFQLYIYRLSNCIMI